MDKIGQFEYPDLGNFNDALSIAREALSKYGGTISNMAAAQKLGYSIKDPKAISGTIYKRFDDLCRFGLFQRDRGGLKTTQLAIDAFDLSDAVKSAGAKARAERNISILGKAFDAWQGEIPDENAFPAKIAEIAAVNWLEAQNHAKTLRSLIIEAFPYLKASSGLPEPVTTEPTGRGMEIIQTVKPEITSDAPPMYAELRSTLGTIIVKDEETWRIARDLFNTIGKRLGVKEGTA